MQYGFASGGGYPGGPWNYNPWWGGYSPWFNYGPDWGAGNWGLGGLRTWGGTYSPQYMSTGIPTDEEIEEMIYDAFDADPIIPYDADINVDVEDGVVTLTGTVPNKRVKFAVGDDAWWAPGVFDVANNLRLSGRRRARNAPREVEEGVSAAEPRRKRRRS